MKTSRFQFEYRDSASKLHRAVGDILRESSLFGNYEIYQEYPVVRVNTDYDDTSHHFDWVILGLNVVIECHGRQHYEAVDFSGKAEDGGIGALRATRKRDNRKKNAAIEAGFTYIEIPYEAEKKLTEQFIWDLYKENLNETVGLVKPKEEPTERHRQRLALAREYRKAAYRRAKDRLAVRSGRAAKSSLQGKGTSEDGSETSK